MLRCEHSLAGRSALTGHHNPGRNLPWVAAIWHFWLVFAPQGGHSEPEISLPIWPSFGLAPFPAWIVSLCTCPNDGKILELLTALNCGGEPARPETSTSPAFGLSGLRYLGA